MIKIKSSISIFPNIANVKLHWLKQLSTFKESEKNWLRLKNPQLIYTEQSRASNNKNSINQFQDVLANDVESIVINRADKKNRNHTKQVDILDSRKNKLKSKKKLRTKIHINDDDDNLATSYSSLTKEDRSLELSLMRPAKPLKKNVGIKTKTNISSKTTKKNILQSKGNKNNNISSLNRSEKVKPAVISLPDTISIEDLANILIIPAAEIIKLLFLKGISVTINQVVDEKIATLVAENYGINIEKNSELPAESKILNESISITDNDSKFKEFRAPIVTILGHVDHGKTTLLNAICNTDTSISEAGGITQAIVAYEVLKSTSDRYQKIIFLDTPGHEAFSDMRIRGTQVTDVGILVVAADDGLKPQTIEAIKYLQNYNLPFLIAINKVDKKEVDISKVKEELAKYSIISEELGGNTPIIEVSALKHINIDKILSTIITLADQQVLKANSQDPASGTILDAYLDKKKGPIANILVQNGTLHKGDYVLIGDAIAKVRAIVNRQTVQIEKAEPSSVVEVWGFTFIPSAGSVFQVITDEKLAKKKLTELHKNKDNNYKINNKLNTRITFDSSSNFKNNISSKTINIILKTDTEGTINAIIKAFSSIPQEKVQINIVSLGVGEVTESDIKLAAISQSILLSFNSIISLQSELLATKSHIKMADFNIIYNLIEYVEQLMLQLVDIDYDEKIIGNAVVETVFAVSKGNVAGCMVTSGKLKHNSYIRIKNNNELIYCGKLTSLKRIKEDVDEVTAGNECGVLCDSFDTWHKQYTIEAYEMVALDKTL